MARRLIINNIIVDYECLHKNKCKKKRKNGMMALKLDINKAYDYLE